MKPTVTISLKEYEELLNIKENLVDKGNTMVVRESYFMSAGSMWHFENKQTTTFSPSNKAMEELSQSLDNRFKFLKGELYSELKSMDYWEFRAWKKEQNKK